MNWTRSEVHCCPRCGTPMHYDEAMGLLWCPRPDCNMVLPREGQLRRSISSDNPAVPEGTLDVPQGEEPIIERRSLRWRLLVAGLSLGTVAAVVVLGLGPLLWPRSPSLAITPGELLFVDETGAGVMPRALAIQNRGSGRLDWQASVDVPWLSIEPPSGGTESALQVVTVKVETLSLPEGTHSGIVSIMAVGARNSPQAIPVEVRLEAPPEARAIRSLLGDNVSVYYDVQPPYVSGPLGTAIQLTRNEAASDVTWAELVEFLRRDDTDRSPYIQDVYMCGSFSELLHNSAEAVGIRAAWVSVDIRGREIGHALNAFFTTDRGLVFVDCTGGDVAVAADGDTPTDCDHDRIAYIRPGMEYGLISLERADSPSYDFYVAYSTSWTAYLADLAEFNRLATEYNALVSGRSLIAGSADARRAQQMHSELQAQRLSLEMQREVLGECRWKSLGVVDKVWLYW